MLFEIYTETPWQMAYNDWPLVTCNSSRMVGPKFVHLHVKDYGSLANVTTFGSFLKVKHLSNIQHTENMYVDR